jgi:hypothetical protein
VERYWQGVPLTVVLDNAFSYFKGIAPKGNFSFFHLWYLWDIWKIAVVLVPILFLANARLSSLMARRWVRLTLLGLGFAATVALKGAPAFDFIYFCVLFSIGYLIFGHIQYFKFEKPGLGLVVSGISYAVLVVYFWRFEYTSMPYQIVYSPELKWAFRFLTQLNVAASIYTIIAVFKEYCNYQNRTVTMLNQVIVPIYILHQLGLMLLGLCCIKAEITPWAAFVLIQTVFWPVVLLVCMGVLKRFAATRVMFGIR